MRPSGSLRGHVPFPGRVESLRRARAKPSRPLSTDIRPE
jgi:hypothetical protein